MASDHGYSTFARVPPRGLVMETIGFIGLGKIGKAHGLKGAPTGSASRSRLFQVRWRSRTTAIPIISGTTHSKCFAASQSANA